MFIAKFKEADSTNCSASFVCMISHIIKKKTGLKSGLYI